MRKENDQQFVFICNGKDCKKRGCKDIQKAIKQNLKQKRKQKAIKVINTKCTGQCKKAPVLIAQSKWLTEMSVHKSLEVVENMLSEAN